MIDKSVFKAYDIRGIFPSQINRDFAYKLGRAAVDFTKAKKVLIGCDNRLSSPELKESLIRGLTDQGADAVEIGLASTPLFNFSALNCSNCDLGIMITASHNPKEWNGFKFLKKNGMPIGLETGLDKIRDLMITGDFEDDKKGLIEKKDFSDQYLNKIFSLIDINKIQPFGVVVDTANAMGGLLIEKIFEKLPCTVEYLYKELDGTYPNHEANPLKTETLKDLRRKVLENKADLGIAFDGDADRVGFIDNEGNVLAGDISTAILAPEILKKYPGGKVIYDLRSSWAVEDQIKKAGGQPIMFKVGRTLIIKKMAEEEAVFAGELSSHFYYKDFYNIESADLSMLYMLQILAEKNEKMSEIISVIDKYYRSGEINFEVENKEKVLKTLEEKYAVKAKDVSYLDGIRLEFEDWWFNVRPSNTEDVIRLNLEAVSEQVMKEKAEEISNLIK